MAFFNCWKRNTGIASLCLAALAAPAVADVGHGESLRFATYNVQLLASHFLATTSTSRANKIADRILAADYDFIALNELQDEEARDAIVAKLSAEYPHYVSYLSESGIGEDDGGLALFSRLPFAELVGRNYLADICEGPDCGKVAFHEFDDCEQPDCLAIKGVGFVRLRNPDTGRIYNVAFTHTQASYLTEDNHGEEAEHQETRRRQLRDAVAVIVDGSGGVPPGEEVFLIGDLNFDGDLRDPIAPNQLRDNREEYNQFFGTNGLLSNGSQVQLVDTWAEDMRAGTLDPGLTNAFHVGSASEGARLDYITRRRDSALCVQHVALAHNLRGTIAGVPEVPVAFGTAGRNQLSDHLGLNADVNLRAPYCRPAEARSIQIWGAQTLSFGGAITYPGSMQWYRVDPNQFDVAAGIRVDGADFDVYRATDLSNPVPGFKNRRVQVAGALGDLFRDVQYIRVYKRDRRLTGNYTLHVRPILCSSQETACPLAPAANPLAPAGFAPSATVTASAPAWYLLQPETAPVGKTQRLRLTIQAPSAALAQHLRVELRESNGTTVLASATAPAGSAQIEMLRQDAGGQARYLVVSYRPLALLPPASMEVTAKWRTDLSILTGGRWGVRQPILLYCFEESDGIQTTEDTILYQARVYDGTKTENQTYLGGFDAGSFQSIDALALPPAPGDRVPFLSGIRFDIDEYDHVVPNDYVLIPPIWALGENDPGGRRRSVGTDDDGDGLYSIEYGIAHGFDEAESGIGSAPDSDGDGLTDADEAALGTNPNDADSDDDGIPDGTEVHTFGTKPKDADTDDDGLTDGLEVSQIGTDPLDRDTDDDGLNDFHEATLDTNPRDQDTDDDGLGDNDEVQFYLSDPLDSDTDNDGLADGDEVWRHQTDPTKADTDSDGLNDQAEINVHGTDPLLFSSDDDDLGDGEEINTYHTKPLDRDTDDDGLSDSDEVKVRHTDPLDADTDNDALNDGPEVNIFHTDPRQPDTDGDGLSDGTEVNVHQTDPLQLDSDNDGLTDSEEISTYRTDPRDADTDNDGFGDGQEIGFGLDPRNADADRDGIPDGKDVEFVQSAINALPLDAFRQPRQGNRNAMITQLDQVESSVAARDYKGAVSKLQQLRTRVDGCGKFADGSDWILDCATQPRIRGLIDLLIANLKV